MKTALPTLAILLSFTYASLGEPASRAPEKRAAAAAHKKCGRCAKAPCRCGFSPSYYTQRRKAVRPRVARHAPVTPHWTRPRCAPAVVPNRSLLTSPRVPRVVPSPAPGLRLGYDHASALQGRPALRRKGTVPSRGTTLVPTPRRPRAVPAITPKQRLGYVPSARKFSRGLGRRTFRR